MVVASEGFLRRSGGGVRGTDNLPLAAHQQALKKRSKSCAHKCTDISIYIYTHIMIL